MKGLLYLPLKSPLGRPWFIISTQICHSVKPLWGQKWLYLLTMIENMIRRFLCMLNGLTFQASSVERISLVNSLHIAKTILVDIEFFREMLLLNWHLRWDWSVLLWWDATDLPTLESKWLLNMQSRLASIDFLIGSLQE